MRLARQCVCVHDTPCVGSRNYCNYCNYCMADVAQPAAADNALVPMLYDIITRSCDAGMPEPL